MIDYAVARNNMIESQLRTNKVTDPAVLEAMAAVPRELFVPKARRGIAYVDDDLPLGRGRCLLEPMVFARLIQAAEIGRDDMVLDVGCALGYSAAVIARLAGTVVALESDREFAAEAVELLAQLDVVNAMVVSGPLGQGHGKQAPYDVIVVEGTVEELPQALSDQLADGGRLVTVQRGEDGIGRATLLVREAGFLARRVLFDASTPLLPGFARRPKFVF